MGVRYTSALFFSSSSIAVLPPHSPSPFEEGWAPTLVISPGSTKHLSPRPLPPWLRHRHATSRGSVIQSPLSYHPKNQLYDISYFGSQSDFETACLENTSLAYPSLPFKNFLPEFLWKDWNALLDWKADFDSVLTPTITETVGRLQDFFSNPHIYLPYRLPNLQEKAKDSELSDLIDTTIQEANPPLRTLHNIIGNFFKPSAVLAALGWPESIQKYVYGGLAPSEWAPIGPSAVELLFTELKTRVHADTISDPDLRTHMAERWFPKKSPPLDKDDFWHTSARLACPPVLTAPMPPLLFLRTSTNTFPNNPHC